MLVLFCDEPTTPGAGAGSDDDWDDGTAMVRHIACYGCQAQRMGGGRGSLADHNAFCGFGVDLRGSERRVWWAFVELAGVSRFHGDEVQSREVELGSILE